MSLILNDHVFWRRNYHPQDPPAINYSELRNKENTEFQERMVNELFKLMAELKFDPPFFSPRYMAHMISEPLLPGLIAYIATLFYNPNNVASEASTVTMEYEIQIGRQLSELFGFDPDTSFGHLTGGGTVANYESLFYNMNLRFLPLSIFFTLKDHSIPESECGLEDDLQKLCNIPYENYPAIVRGFQAACESRGVSPSILEKNKIGALGLRGLDRLSYRVFGAPLPEIRIIAPASCHYSWSRGAKLLGLGQDSLIKIKMDSDFQMDVSHLQREIEAVKSRGDCVLQLVSVYGTTELGSFDPVHQVAQIRSSSSEKGLYFPIHVDAAYGGYFSTVCKRYDGDAKGSRFYQSLREKHEGLQYCESVTVDPHKLGYAPYGAGAFIFKHGDLKEFVAEDAQYCFNPKGGESKEQLGKYILEGSKPGASAAAVYFNHKLIPLNHGGYGKILENLALTGSAFYRRLLSFRSEYFKIVPLCEPQSNIVCFYIIPHGDDRVSSAHRYTSELAARFGIKEIKGIQEYEYIVSNTTINFEHFARLPSSINDLKRDANELCLVRMVFMNQWHGQEIKNGKGHLDLFLENLAAEFASLKDSK